MTIHPSTSSPNEPCSDPLHLSPAECQLILHVRGLQFGSIEVKIQNGIPVFLEKVIEKIKLV